jgi:hypothetical protein
MKAIAGNVAATASAAGTATQAAGGQSQQQALQLPLQMFSTKTPSDLLLRQLAVSSSSNLTKLDLTGPIFVHFPDTVPAAAAALSGLTGLRSMSLCLAQVTQDAPHPLASSCAAALLPALVHLTSLTALKLLRAGADVLLGWQHLPASLQQLDVSNDGVGPELSAGAADWGDDASRLQLSHLTALTDLQLSGSSGFGVFRGNVLPPNLVALRATDPAGVSSVEPLLPLQQLQRLTMKCDSLPAAKLQQLSSLRQLTEVQLQYTSSAAAAEAAEVWPALPISALRLGNWSKALPAAALLSISKLQCLTCLHLMPCHAAVTAQQFAAVVAQLTGLVELQLQSMLLAQPRAAEAVFGTTAAAGEPPAAAAAGPAAGAVPAAATQGQSGSSASAFSNLIPDYSCIVSAIVGLPALRCLAIKSVHLGAAVAQLAAGPAAAAALRKLRLTDCRLEDAHLLPVLQQTPSLRKLNVSHNILLSNAALEGAAAQLTGLKKLDVRFSSVTSAAANSLRGRLPQLMALQVGRPSRQVGAKPGCPA